MVGMRVEAGMQHPAHRLMAGEELQDARRVGDVTLDPQRQGFQLSKIEKY